MNYRQWHQQLGGNFRPKFPTSVRSFPTFQNSGEKDRLQQNPAVMEISVGNKKLDTSKYNLP